MQFVFFLILQIVLIFGIVLSQDCLNEEAFECYKKQNESIYCVINDNNIKAVNEGIQFCSSSDSSIPTMQISIVSPLSGDLRLDMLANNILYLAINNKQQNQSVSLAVTTDVPYLLTLAIQGIGSYSITNSTFFSHFIRIEKITLSSTSFHSLPSFSHLHTLTYLSINYSSLSHHSNVHVGEEFVGGLDQLKYLLVSSYLSTVSLSALALRGLTSLTGLYLKSNNIPSIPENLFRDSRALTYISLSHNNITFLSSQTIQQLPHLASVDVSDNPLNCSCPLQWMSIAASKFDFFFMNASCKYPQESVNKLPTSPSTYGSCPSPSLSLQCLNRSNPLCPSPLSCYNTATSYQCSACPPGYGQVSDSACVDLDSCSRVPSPCGDNTTCVNTVGSFLCLPPSNPCDTRNGSCEQKCEFNGSSHWCTCYAGFKFVNDTLGQCETSYSDSIGLYLLLVIFIPLCVLSWILTAGIIIVCCYSNNQRRKYQLLNSIGYTESPDVPTGPLGAAPPINSEEMRHSDSSSET